MFKSRVLTFLNKITPLVDLLVLYELFKYFNSHENEDYHFVAYLMLALIGYVLFRWGKAFWLVSKSKREAYDYLLSNRVIPICGKQRVGKSSLASYFATVNIGKVYSNIPLRIRGRFTNKLNSDMLTCRKRVEDGSMFIVDEASLFYNNVKSDDVDSNIFGQAVLCQCVGHFFDGNILYVSVDTDRLPKPIRDCYSAQIQVVESVSYKYSFLGDILLHWLAKMLLRELRIFTGLRCWKAQHYEHIRQEQYISLLGDKSNEFAPLMTFASFQNFGLSTYDDRYMKAYYLDKPVATDDMWTSLILNKTDFEQLYDGAVIAYLNKIRDEQKQEEKRIHIIDSSE